MNQALIQEDKKPAKQKIYENHVESNSTGKIFLNRSESGGGKWYHNIKYVFAGIIFGILLVKGQVISWFRIQEMFRLQSFHMYGVIGSAVLVGVISVFVIKKLDIKTIRGEKIEFKKKAFTKGQVYGGLLFGCGWALTGACPGPLFAQLGTGVLAISVVILSAIAGTWVYGALRNKLPH
jgi:uncharacterized membrane protein YedE/YeeE